MTPTVHLDETDAWKAADVHFERVIATLDERQRVGARMELKPLRQSDGGVQTLWVGDSIRIMAVVVRNSWNRSVLVVTDMGAP